MTKLALTAILLISQMVGAQNLAKLEVLETPRICKIEKTNFNGLQAGNISHTTQVVAEDPRLVRLVDYIQQRHFSFLNKGVKVTHSLNVGSKYQTAEKKNSLTYVGVMENATATVTFTVQDTNVLVNLKYEIKNKQNVIITSKYFEASCALP